VNADTVIIAVTRAGTRLAARLAAELRAAAHVPAKFAAEAPDATPYTVALLDEVRTCWGNYRALVLIMASGIAVRAIAPLIARKTIDPAVVVLDESGGFVIPLLGGHQAGANDLARRIAVITGGQAAITTASDTRGLPALDLLGRDSGWRIADDSALTHAMACLVNGDLVGCFVDPALPDARRLMIDHGADCPNLEYVDDPGSLTDPRFAAAILVTHRQIDDLWQALRAKGVRYLPPVLAVGIGCRRGTPVDELHAALHVTLADAGLDPRCIGVIATADIKADEAGLVEIAGRLNVPLHVVSRSEITALDAARFSPSAAVTHFDLPGVAEPCAVIAGGGDLLVPKRAFQRCTVAVALRNHATHQPSNVVTSSPALPAAPPSGVLTLVGIGPGDLSHLTYAAHAALRDADVVAGYRVYIDLIRPLLQSWQEVIVAPAMGDEIGRARQAIAVARSGRRVALISSGDAGIYAMAAPVFEILRDEGWTGDHPVVDVVPGISAFQALAARLGAPIGHDMCIISLSDLLTPWDVIERRLRAAAQADFIVALYNPRSRGRDWQLDAALNIMRTHRPPTTPVAFGRNVSRADERITLTTLAAADPSCADMFTVVLIGNSQSYILGDRMATPRGYARKGQVVLEETVVDRRDAPTPGTQRDYPVTLINPGDLSAVVIGGGAVGERKVRGLLNAGIPVRLVSPTATPHLAAWADAGLIVWNRREYEPGDLAGVWLVFAATDQRDVNAQIARNAAAAGILCNVVDAPEEGSFHVPAVHRSGGITIAVSSGGAAPARAVALRNALAQWLGEGEVEGGTLNVERWNVEH
jgi:cobalt-precorrin 5A hydrolase/precorrin-3B C17-methyltransferase